MDKPKRGRPRPQETIDRDEQIWRLLEEGKPLTRGEIMEKTGLSPVQIYLSLNRLRSIGKATYVGGHRTKKFWARMSA
jgi:DNA-binding transcriptional regulator GbsR (MarR family)